MDTQQHSETSPKITLNLDEFDIESYDFKPVTKGLGFHNNASAGVKPRVNNPQSVQRVTPAQRRQTAPTPARSLQSAPQTVSDPSLLSGIDALYGTHVPEMSVKREAPVKMRKELKEASFGEMILSYLLDLSLIVGITSLLFTSFFIFAFKRFEGEMMITFLRDSLPFILVLASLIYLTYFSLLEPVGTFGKKLLALGTFQTGSEHRSTIKSSFIRALISLMSLPLLGIPLVLDFHGKLSDTKILKLK